MTTTEILQQRKLWLLEQLRLTKLELEWADAKARRARVDQWNAARAVKAQA